MRIPTRLRSLLFNELARTETQTLEIRMHAFYATTDSYLAFQNESEGGALWRQVESRIREALITGDTVRILEIGSGRSGFYRLLDGLPPHFRERVIYSAQDITEKNLTHLQAHADEVLICSILDIKDKHFHIIFHSFVLEHLTRPSQYLNHIANLLIPGGKMIFSCPNYSVPLYFAPSTRHLSWPQKIGINLFLLLHSFGRSTDPILVADPAIFHLPFRRDEDAIHLVCRQTILNILRPLGAVSQFPSGSRSLREFLMQRILQLHFEFQKS